MRDQTSIFWYDLTKTMEWIIKTWPQIHLWEHWLTNDLSSGKSWHRFKFKADHLWKVWIDWTDQLSLCLGHFFFFNLESSNIFFLFHSTSTWLKNLIRLVIWCLQCNYSASDYYGYHASDYYLANKHARGGQFVELCVGCPFEFSVNLWACILCRPTY